jgi:IS1 family transposase
VPLDALFARLSAVKTGQMSDAEALTQLSRSSQWVWGAIDPATKRLLALDGGDRTREMAQRLVQRVVAV